MNDPINDLIDQAIAELADDNVNSGCGSLTSLAQAFAKAGLGMESFLNVRKYILDTATEKTDHYFIAEKLKLAEREAQHERGRYVTDQARGKTQAEGLSTSRH